MAQAAHPGTGRAAPLCPSIRPCIKWGLHSRKVTNALVSSYLTFPPLPQKRRYLSVALSLRSPSLGVTQHPALRSSDFPLLTNASSDHLTYLLTYNNRIKVLCKLMENSPAATLLFHAFTLLYEIIWIFFLFTEKHRNIISCIELFCHSFHDIIVYQFL